MDLTMETIPMAITVIDRKIEGVPGQFGRPAERGQKELVMELDFNLDTLVFALEQEGIDYKTNREYLDHIKTLRTAKNVLTWMLERKVQYEEALSKAAEERNASIAKIGVRDNK